MWLILSLLFASWTMAQTPADLYALEEYRAWLARQNNEVRNSSDVLDTYRAYLVERGMDHADADSQIHAIREQEAEENPPDCFVAIVKKMPAGRALDSTGHAAWLTRRGWKVTEGPPRKGSWNLIVTKDGPGTASAAQLRAALVRAGIAVKLEGRKCTVIR